MPFGNLLVHFRRNSSASSFGNLWAPIVNYINVIHVPFLCKIFGAKTSNPKHSFVIFGTKILYKKCACKMLMKLTPIVKFTNILWAAFKTLFFEPKIKVEKSSAKHFRMRKLLIKCWRNWHLLDHFQFVAVSF